MFKFSKIIRRIIRRVSVSITVAIRRFFSIKLGFSVGF